MGGFWRESQANLFNKVDGIMLARKGGGRREVSKGGEEGKEKGRKRRERRSVIGRRRGERGGRRGGRGGRREL